MATFESATGVLSRVAYLNYLPLAVRLYALFSLSSSDATETESKAVSLR